MCAVIFAFQVVFITFAGQKMSAKLLTFLPLVFVSLGMLVVSCFTGEIVLQGPNISSAVLNVALAAFFATILAGICQVLGQRRVDPSRAAIIMSTESVFTCIISVILGFDALSLNLILGGIIIVIAIVISELK